MHVCAFVSACVCFARARMCMCAWAHVLISSKCQADTKRTHEHKYNRTPNYQASTMVECGHSKFSYHDRRPVPKIGSFQVHPPTPTHVHKYIHTPTLFTLPYTIRCFLSLPLSPMHRHLSQTLVSLKTLPATSSQLIRCVYVCMCMRGVGCVCVGWGLG